MSLWPRNCAHRGTRMGRSATKEGQRASNEIVYNRQQLYNVAHILPTKQNKRLHAGELRLIGALQTGLHKVNNSRSKRNYSIYSVSSSCREHLSMSLTLRPGMMSLFTPSRACDTASPTPATGLRTATGTALSTAFTHPPAPDLWYSRSGTVMTEVAVIRSCRARLS